MDRDAESERDASHCEGRKEHLDQPELGVCETGKQADRQTDRIGQQCNGDGEKEHLDQPELGVRDGGGHQLDCRALLAGAGRRGDERRVGGRRLSKPVRLRNPGCKIFPHARTKHENAKHAGERDLSFSRAVLSLDSASRARCSAADRKASE